MKSQSKDVDYLNRYNIVLFICLDYNQEDIALYLINQGMDVHIFKQVRVVMIIVDHLLS
jgi:hypothetical protein